jgi:hypothetical protein
MDYHYLLICIVWQGPGQPGLAHTTLVKVQLDLVLNVSKSG